MIKFKHVSFSYDEDEKPTLEDVSFHVKQGEWVSIIGHNGSGKSTTARLIDGLLEAQKGQIYIDGDLLEPDNVWEKRRLIGMVFQNPDNQFVGATVEDDVAFGLENQGLDIEEMKVRVKQSLQDVNMYEFINREPSRLSGGQKQRVAIAGVIALRPKILILDEVTSMLDPQGRNELIKTIAKVKEEFGMTVLSITHDLDEIELSDRVILMKEGRVEEIACPANILARSDLNSIGLSAPFTSRVKQALQEKGWSLPEGYLTEEELQEYLWESYLNR